MKYRIVKVENPNGGVHYECELLMFWFFWMPHTKPSGLPYRWPTADAAIAGAKETLNSPTFTVVHHGEIVRTTDTPPIK